MNKKLRSFLEKNGLRADATDKEAWVLYDQLRADGIELPGIQPGERAAASGEPASTATNATSTAGEPTTQRAEGDAPLFTQADIDAAADKAAGRALVADVGRRNEVQNMLTVAGMSDHENGNFARTLLDNPEMTTERASQEIFKAMGSRTSNVPFGAGAHTGIQVGVEAGQKLRSAVSDGLLLRSGVQVEKPADGAGDFRGRHLTEICRQLLESTGVSCRGMSQMDMVGRALSAGSTSDFPAIFGGLVNQFLQKAYTEWAATWRPFVAVTGANDFKDIHSIKLSGAPDLEPLGENGEYKMASFADAKESYRVITKAIMVALTRQMIINDDLRAFTRIPALFGASAKRMEGDAVYSLITANAVMGDSYALFNSQHNNLGVAAALSSDSLGKGRKAMRRQKGMKGERIDVTPAFVLTPTEMETDAEILLRSAALPNADMSSGVHNPWAGKLTPIADPRLDDDSTTAWYLMAHPNQVPTIEVAYLEGVEQPYVEETVDFNSDALKIKVRHDFGAGVVDHIGIYKNAGA